MTTDREQGSIYRRKRIQCVFMFITCDFIYRKPLKFSRKLRPVKNLFSEVELGKQKLKIQRILYTNGLRKNWGNNTFHNCLKTYLGVNLIK